MPALMARNPKVYDRMVGDLPINAVVTTIVVDDPYEPGAKVRVRQSLRDDVLAHLRARETIDEAQFQAGRLYEKYVERSQIGSVKAMDPTKEPVDGGGGVVEPVSDRQVAAVRQLSEAARILGRRGEFVVRAVLCDRKKFRDVARSQKEGDIAHVRLTFIDGLEELALFWNLAGR